MSEGEGQFQTSSRPIKTVLPIDTTEFPIRLMDWRRVFRKVRQIPEHSALYSNLGFLMFGVCGSTALAMIPLFQPQVVLEAWVKPTCWAVGVASTLLGLVFTYLARDKDSEIKSSRDEVMTDMKDIHQCYFPGQEIEPPIAAGNPLVRLQARFCLALYLGLFVMTVCAIRDFGGMQGWFITFAVIMGIAAFIMMLVTLETASNSRK